MYCLCEGQAHQIAQAKLHLRNGLNLIKIFILLSLWSLYYLCKTYFSIKHTEKKTADPMRNTSVFTQERRYDLPHKTKNFAVMLSNAQAQFVCCFASSSRLLRRRRHIKSATECIVFVTSLLGHLCFTCARLFFCYYYFLRQYNLFIDKQRTLVTDYRKYDITYKSPKCFLAH